MNAAIQPILLVVDDNLADIALLETAWMHAGHDKTIGIFVCNSYDEAMVWLRDDIPHSYVISGVLVDLMLRDGVGTAAVNRLSALPILKDVPVISWIGSEIGQTVTESITSSSIRVWEKPRNWLGWSDFIRRFHQLLDVRSKSSRTRLTTA
jgi:CheY-like chemotaxis protein